jgi:hypothetical protein
MDNKPSSQETTGLSSMDNKPLVQTVAVTILPVWSKGWLETLSMEQLLLLARLYSLPGPSFPIQFEPLEPSLNVSSIQRVKFLLRQSMQPVISPTPQLGLLRPQYEDLPNLRPNDKPQCNDAAMSVEVSVEPDTKELDSQPSQEKKQSSNAVILADQSENQE